MQPSSFAALALVALALTACGSGNVKSARDYSAPAAPTVKQPFYNPAASYGSANATWVAPIYNRAGTIVRPTDPGTDTGRPDYEHAEWATGTAGGSRNAPAGTF